jgi:hypothetical protein
MVYTFSHLDYLQIVEVFDAADRRLILTGSGKT